MLFSKKKYSVRAMLRGKTTHYINTVVEARTKKGALKLARTHFTNKYAYELNKGVKLIMNKEPQELKEVK